VQQSYLAVVNTYRVWADIDFDALTHNLTTIRRTAGSGVRIMLVVKADAYGHGAVPVAHHAVRCGVAALGVSTSAEALELRQSGLRVPILVLGTLVDDEVPACLHHRVHLGLHSADRLRMLRELAERTGITARVHLNVDTGMGGLGVLPARALELLRDVHASPNVSLEGIMTHIASPEGALVPESAEQISAFRAVLEAARAEDLVRGWIHASNSASIFTGLEPGFDTVRPGISAYGILPRRLADGRLRPVMSLRSQVVFLKDLPQGASVGYASTWRAPQTTRIATIPAGYNDGVAWRLSNRAHVLVRGKRAPIVGRVSMDYVTVDVGGIPGVSVGDRVTLIGSDGDEEITVEELADQAGTIPYEITCSVGRRVTRVPRGGEDLLIPSQEAPLASSLPPHTQTRNPLRDPEPTTPH
jgi:alanine racemase